MDHYVIALAIYNDWHNSEKFESERNLPDRCGPKGVEVRLGMVWPIGMRRRICKEENLRMSYDPACGFLETIHIQTVKPMGYLVVPRIAGLTG